MKRFGLMILSFTLVCAIALGSHLSGLQNGASRLVNGLFPVSYDVTYFDHARGSSVTAENVSVRFSAEQATLSNGVQVSPAFAQFVCLNEDALTRNTQITGIVALFFGIVLYGMLVCLASIGIDLCRLEAERAARRRAQSARRRAEHTARLPERNPIRRQAA